MKEPIIKVFQKVFLNGVIDKIMNSTFITLVPSKVRFVKVKEFWPISQVMSVYNTITKVLSSKPSEILGDTISQNQCAFVPGRQIVDALLVETRWLKILVIVKVKVKFSNWIMRKLMIG